MILHSVFQQIWKTHQWPQVWKRSVFIPVAKKGNAKNIPTTIQLFSFHMLARLCPISFKLGFSSIWTEDFQMDKLGLEKAEKPEIKLPTSTGSSKSKRVPEKHIFLLYWLCQSLCVDHNKLENSERDRYTRPPDLPLEKPICRSGSNS